MAAEPKSKSEKAIKSHAPEVQDVRPQSWADPGTWSASTKWMPAYIAVAAVAIALLYVRFLRPSGLDTSTFDDCIATFDYSFRINAALSQAHEQATHSWEIGYAHEATMQIFNPERSVFGSDPFPGGELPTLGLRLDEASLYAQPRIRTHDKSLFDEESGAVSDPAALGMAALMLGRRSWNSKAYREAAERQKDLLLRQAPRYVNGAISHRWENAELWSDAPAMFPPFLAYYGVATNDTDLVHEAVVQIGLHRDVLRSDDGLWKHIIGSPDDSDEGYWSSGNAWTSYGMTRLRATISAWSHNNATLADDQRKLDSWIKELLDAVISSDDHESGLLRNYLQDKDYDGETSGTSLLAATTYRMAILNPEVFGQRKYLDWANAKRHAVVSRVDEDGIASPAANPLDHKSKVPVDISPEGQNSLLLLGAAWRDCVCNGLCMEMYVEEHGLTSQSELTPKTVAGPAWKELWQRVHKYFQPM
ncbi:hypothetical protein CB0940_09002 [Cercospora beticola]|uniref:Uncharacterized protein n=1 Tax=Cercospora beticola TaxID=122368 RepID=A0A2G5HGH0_CERBT|nr:hypothetical protein CB0940_09002 [Cercospora beticola]PIA91647.1 hypothetical protein CB0940_09002 [Cercospora beticola]WPB06726.1 hypothetical protein RHO25_011386 [Cercospora beticola]CAK1366643.1 unnamed protein product [Cercospora beticola]